MSRNLNDLTTAELVELQRETHRIEVYRAASKVLDRRARVRFAEARAGVPAQREGQR